MFADGAGGSAGVGGDAEAVGETGAFVATVGPIACGEVSTGFCRAGCFAATGFGGFGITFGGTGAGGAGGCASDTCITGI